MQEYEKALALRPRDPGVLGHVGMALWQMGRPEEGRIWVERAIALNPREPRLHNYLGNLLQELGDKQSAEFAYVEAFKLDPRYVEAWYNAGRLFLDQHRPSDALAALREAERLAPADSDTLLALAKAHFQMRSLDEATALLTCIHGSTQRAVADIWLAAVLRSQGRRDEALELEVRAVKSMSEDALFEVLMDLGRTELHVGNLSEAERHLLHAMEIRPDKPQPLEILAQARKFSEEDRPLVQQMELMLPDLDGKQARAMSFSLGKVYSDLKDYDRAFGYYKRGNDEVRKAVPYDVQNGEAQTSRLIERFSRERIASLPRGTDSNLPILIVGTPRSGTTLTEQIISSHSQVAGAGEHFYWSRAVPHVMAVFPDGYDAALAQRLAREYELFLRQHSKTAARITDKMPGNFQHVGLIHSVFPNAKIIHAMRHPIDACLSIYFQNFPDGHAYKWDLESLAAWYEQYQRLMAHWRSVLPPGVMYESQYEDLVEDVEGESRKIMEFLGLEWEPGQLEFYKQDRAVFTASKWQARQPIYKSSKERWRVYEKHLGPLMPLLKYAPQQT